MYFFYVPSFKMIAYGACLIKCHINSHENKWCYKVKQTYTNDKLVPANAQIYYLPDELEQLTLLTHSEAIERNGLTILFVQKGTMGLINPVGINRSESESLGDKTINETEKLQNLQIKVPTLTIQEKSPTEAIERLGNEMAFLKQDFLLYGVKTGDVQDTKEAIKPFLEKYKELVSLCWGLIDENERLKAKVPLGLSIARGKRLD